MNTNDFSRVKVGDKLWSLELGHCVVANVRDTIDFMILATSGLAQKVYTKNGKANHYDNHQSLFFGEPQIIAPPEPVRLPDYKPGDWIMVWSGPDKNGGFVRQFEHFKDDRIGTRSGGCVNYWDNHCALSELPEVLAKWGEK